MQKMGILYFVYQETAWYVRHSDMYALFSILKLTLIFHVEIHSQNYLTILLEQSKVDSNSV